MPIDAKLMDRLFSSPQLPSMPAVAMQIIDLVQEDEANVDKIAETISLDPALSTKMLKTVNSSFYGLPKTIGSVHQAVVVLGLNAVKTLALGFSLVGKLTQSEGLGFDPMAFWRRSLYCATAAKELCDRLGIVQAEEVFMSSLLQDVGVLALVQVLREEYAMILEQTQGDHRKLGKIETELLGGDHADVGGALTESWGLPPLLVESIRLHERADDAPEDMQQMIRVVHAGAYTAELIEHPEDQQRVRAFHMVLSGWFGIEQAEAEAFLEKTCQEARQTQRLFELPTGELNNTEDIMARAREALEMISLQNARVTGELQQENQELAKKAQRDAVTGLYNRRHFDEQLDELFLSVTPENPLSLVFIDLDHFKSVNDTHGHDAGDAVLVAIAETLEATSKGRGDAFRYGGDEFLMLSAGMSRQDAATLAETLRVNIIEAMSKLSIGEAGVAPGVTGSIGVATYEGTLFKRPEQLVKAADKGAYAAKTSGRNAVRVFVPKAA
ncbi:MAG: sensor domain-containing diguanylate cyclase [Phycisphaeraceae bacterium]